MALVRVFRDGAVHVLTERCKSCIFRSVNDGRIRLNAGRVGEMVQTARANESVIPCHSTLYRRDVKPAVCRGYYDLPQPVQALQIAQRLGYIVFDPVPADE